ncbi:MAG: hypothetical protein ACREMQ_08245 [Longimicrobiales bacterium]
MSALYWFALIIGAGLLLMSLFGDLFGHGHGFDGSHGGDVGGHGHAHADDQGFQILSMRNATYFLFAFGAAGLLMGWAMGGERPVLTALLAGLLGLVGGGISATVFGWVSRTETGYMEEDTGWIGRTGEVVLPLSAEGTGKVLVNRSGRDHELLARPYDRSAESPERWRSVMIVELENGIALVSPYAPALDVPDDLRISPSTES